MEENGSVEKTASTEGVQSANSAQHGVPGKPCRYGLECTRPNCKFWHGSQPVQHGSDFTGISSQHWVPSHLRLRVLPEGGLVTVKPDQQELEESELVITVYLLILL